MGKGTHFFGNPLYFELIKCLNKAKILQISREMGGERYVKSFDAWHHVVTMLYAVIKRFDSLREITTSLLVDARKLQHLGITTMPKRSTLADANARRPEKLFEWIYRDLYERYHNAFSADSHSPNTPKWLHKLRIIDSTTISLFSNLIFKGVGRNPKTGKKKGGIKAHMAIYANEFVPCDVFFSSAARHDFFLLAQDKLHREDIIAMDRAYIDYALFEKLTQSGVIYVTKMKKNLVYEILEDRIWQLPEGVAEVREQIVVFTKVKKDEVIKHQARIITYTDAKNKHISLLTNDMKFDPQEIIAIYRKRWEIELLFKQIKQNFPLRYFYGESANAIKIQIWTTLIANLLIMLIKSKIKRPWSFSGLATVIRISLMSYLNPYSLLENPELDWENILLAVEKSPPQPTMLTLFD